ncbi:LysR family transcriptional regulator [Mammaliicoccus sp. Dog046]|uniref:LysR family transcriptional regulator n=1 Tax=Mammaliicoccus sp. Dog046 TaxID=3034233 RepID=UPI002B25C36A|nr:LysR family transcriptional regulator [Mammaliicoccus sp. Dog046]WQK85625.1 LysR family transcriptional regulator [Mammaliicoccus sp. Dog046]
MNFNDLLIFKTVFELKSINKAALHLQYAQSNISQRVHHIEKELNVTLFKRTKNGILPNKSSEEFYHYCVNILSETEKLKSKLQNNRDALLCSELLFSYLSVKNMDFINFDIDLATTSKIETKLREKHYDQVISFSKCADTEYVLEKVESIDLAFFTNTQSTDSLPLLINKDELCPLRKLSLQLNNNQKQIIELDSLEGIINLVELGKGTGLLPTYLERSRSIKRISQKDYHLEYYYYHSK